MARADDFFTETALPSRDLLGHEALVHEVTEILLTAHTPLTVMVNGPWGSGKTTFLRSLLRHARESSTHHAGHRAATMWFNPWEHEDVQHIMVPFLNTLRARACLDDPTRQAQYTESERSLLAELLWMLVPDDVQLPPSWRAAIQPHWLRARFQTLLTRRQGLAGLRGEAAWWPLHKPQEQLSTRIRRQFIEYVDAIRRSGYDRLLIFLDDLDRCRPRLMLEMLDLVKVNLVGSATRNRDVLAPSLPVVFVFAIDHQTLIRAVRAPDSPTPSADYSKYLDKIFDFRFSLPRLHQGDIPNLVPRLVDSRLPETVASLRRPIAQGSEGGRPTTFESLLVEIVGQYQELRTVRIIRRIINKLMAFRYVRRVEEQVARDPDLFGPGSHSLAHRLATGARLVVAWHAFGQAWLSTLHMALQADGLGLKLLLGLLGRLELEPAAQMPQIVDDLRRHDVSASGIRFLVWEILIPLGVARDLRAPTRSDGSSNTTGPTGNPVSPAAGGRAPGPPTASGAPRYTSNDEFSGRTWRASPEPEPEPESEPESERLHGQYWVVTAELNDVVNRLLHLDTHVRRAPY